MTVTVTVTLTNPFISRPQENRDLNVATFIVLNGFLYKAENINKDSHNRVYNFPPPEYLLLYISLLYLFVCILSKCLVFYHYPFVYPLSFVFSY